MVVATALCLTASTLRDIITSTGGGEARVMATSLSQHSTQLTRASAHLKAVTTLLRSLLPMSIPTRANLILKNSLKQHASGFGRVLTT